MHNVIKTFR